ncbi:MAG: hypothetical protein IJF08_03120, partial [Clostridia bacterium]|nr:hypothetical protein [Clostridia bacterium]
MKKQRYSYIMLCLLLLCVFLAMLLCSCNQKNEETVTMYPCYFNQNVEGVDGATIRATLEQAGWVLNETKQDDKDGSTYYLYTETDKIPTRGVIAITEFPDAQKAEQEFLKEWTTVSVMAGVFTLESEFHTMRLRISNCTIMTLGNAHADLLEMLDIKAVEGLEIPLENTYEIRKDIKSVDIEAVKVTMEADGYQFYATDYVLDDETDEFSNTYIIISPEQDRIYAYTLGDAPKWGVPGAYRFYQAVERHMNSADLYVGIHFVGFKDGSCILCYGDSFEEIHDYFV